MQVPLVKHVFTPLAVYAPMLSLKLERRQGYPQGPQLITIEASGDSRGGVIVQDVLRIIHEDLRIPFPRHELRNLGVEGRVEINTAFGEGCKSEEEELSKIPRKILHLGSWDRLQILPRLWPDGSVLLPTLAIPSMDSL